MRYTTLRKRSLVRIIDEASKHFNKEGDIVEIQKQQRENLPPIKPSKEYCVKFFDNGAESWFAAAQLPAEHKVPRKKSFVHIIDETSEFFKKEGVVIESRNTPRIKELQISDAKYWVKFKGGRKAWFTNEQLLRLKRPVDRKDVGFGNIDFSKVKNILSTYVTVVEFAIIKECTPETIYRFIRQEQISIVTVGLTKERVMIDLEAHKGLVYKKENETPEQRERREAHVKKNWGKQVDAIREIQKYKTAKK